MRLEIEHVTKTYPGVTALKDFSVTFEAGIYAILGANGAGKSTLINLITDNIKRDSGSGGGSIRYDGEEILRMGGRFRSLLGYMPQQQGYYEEFTASAFLRYMAALKGIPKKQAQRECDRLLDIVNLTRWADSPVGGFSGGMRQRVLLAQALLGEPKILILDEPTAGLDPRERIGIRNYISRLSKDKIILFATHVVSDIESIADRVLLMDHGELVREGTPQELIREIDGNVAEVVCAPQEAERLQQTYRVGNIRQRSDGIALRLVGDDLPREYPRVHEDINLEDVFLYYVGTEPQSHAGMNEENAG